MIGLGEIKGGMATKRDIDGNLLETIWIGVDKYKKHLDTELECTTCFKNMEQLFAPRY